MWRTPRTAWACAPSAGWSATSPAPAAAGWSRSPASAGTGSRSCPAGGAGSCCGSTAARRCSSRRSRWGSCRCARCCPTPSAPTTWSRRRSVTGERARELAHGHSSAANAADERQRGGLVSAFDAIDVIRTKRDGGQLSAGQIRWVVDAYTRGAVPDEQMSALLMAIFFRGMSPDELAVWTQAMIDSGERKDLSSLGRPTADKHSTGGVGDKITLPLAPLVAACGVAVPQLSGRGLGHTGGTLDKLESIPGWRADVHEEAYLRQLREVGAVICAAGNDLAPADKRLYALRDVTGTVESIPLIASSIMSKKIAEGADALVLDVKTGSGAFMKDPESSRELARTMVGLGEAAGVRTIALVTAMDRPLGRTAGNAVEVEESVEVLAGGGPADVVELTLALAREMLGAVGRDDVDPADALADGRAMDVWRRMVAAQGGDPDAALPQPAETHVVTAPASGTLTRLDAYSLGVAAWRLGAGRARKEDPVSAAAGIVWTAGVGEQVQAGQPLLELQTDDAARIPRALEALEGAIGVDTDDELLPLVLDRITA